MDLGTKRSLLVAFVIAAIGLTACVVKTAPRRGHGYQPAHSHEKQKSQKHKKQKKHGKHKH